MVELLKLEPGDRLAIRVEGVDSESVSLIADAVKALQEAWGIQIILLAPGADLTVIRD